METSFFDTPLFEYGIIPLLIMVARITDVSIGTMRVIFVSKGYKLLAAMCGFFEVLIWILAITQIMKNLTNPVYYFAYATGFATGNFMGMLIEEKIALGNVLLRVITPNELTELTEYLRDKDYGVTLVKAEGMSGMVKILFTIVPRAELGEILEVIQKVNPKAFYTIEDVRFVNEKNLLYQRTTKRNKMTRFLRRSLRKGK